jgi:hypothetical protein
VDPPVSPRLVLPRQPQHHRPHPAMRRRAPRPAPPRPACPAAADDVPVPAHDRARSDNQSHHRQALRRHRPRKQRQPRPVRPRQTRMSARPLALSHSELMAQHKDLGILPPPFPPRQPSSDTARTTIKKISFNPTSQRSSHALAWRRRPGSQQLGEHPARWHRFSAPTGTRATVAPRDGPSHATDPAAKPQLTARNQVSERYKGRLGPFHGRFVHVRHISVPGRWCPGAGAPPAGHVDSQKNPRLRAMPRAS